MHRSVWLCLCLTGLMLSGCASNDVVIKKQMETDSRVEKLLQSNIATNAQLSELSRELQELKGAVASQKKSLDSLKSGQDNLHAFLEAIPRQSAPTSPAVAEPAAPPPPQKIEVVNTESSKPEKADSQQEAYMKAYGIFSANRYTEAVTAFTAFIDSYPGSEFASNAQYWIGECYYTQKDFQKALDSFNVVLDRYPSSKKVPDAMLKIAFAQISLNDQDKAKEMLQKLIDTYPKSPAAGKARERLNRL